MAVKILLAAESKSHSAIIGVDGKLRLIDPPNRCMGYRNGCVCRYCKKRAGKPRQAPRQPKQPWEAAA